MSTELSRSQPIGHSTAYVLVIVTMAIWASPPVVARAVSADVPPLALSFARWLIALVLLTPFAWRKLPMEWPRLKHHWRSLGALATFMTAGSSLSVVAVYFTTATNAVIVNASQPAITAVIVWLVARDGLSLRQGVGIGCAFIGIMVMISRADLAVLMALDINIGDLIMLLAVVGWSLYAVYLHRRDYVPGAEVLLFVIALTGTLILLPLYLIEAAVLGPFALSAEVFWAMVYLAALATVLATFLWNLSVRSLGANRTAIFVNLIPIFGVAFAMFFLGERLFVYHILGGALVFAGIFLAVRKRRANGAARTAEQGAGS